ncbi:MAG: hypothetical protein J0L84_04865 [Verrucomicrobia bacterium]|nr:hypothetical protein [Verrucomicrobiota bacterium]
MRSILNKTFAATVLLASLTAVHGFSLLGPFDPEYQTEELNYGRATVLADIGDLGGPMNLSEEYRFGSPVLVYGFDSTFTEFFGDAGVEAVEGAVEVLNDLPMVSAMSPGLEEFQLNTTRFNVVAQQLRLLDLKSMSLSLLLQQMGLAAPERFTWTLRDRWPIPNTQPQQYTYMVIQRNLDPLTWQYSSYVNNTLYTYQMFHSIDPDFSDAQEVSVDVGNPNVSVIALASVQAGFVDPRVRSQIYGPGRGVFGGFGLFYSGITRDDAGGIRYLYRTGNVNWQAPPLGSSGGGGGGGGGGSSPWTIVGFEVLNPLPGSPWNVVGGGIFGFTNTVGDGGVIVGAAPPDGGRGGPGKLAFVRVDVDPLLGQYTTPVTIRYPETVINAQGVQIQSFVTRVITQPDVLFTAADVGVPGDASQPYTYGISGVSFTQVQNPGGSPLIAAGPGIIEPGVVLAFNKVGPWVYNVLDTAEEDGIRGFVWGSFDGTTNTPIVYPQGATAEQIESLLFE